MPSYRRGPRSAVMKRKHAVSVDSAPAAKPNAFQLRFLPHLLNTVKFSSAPAGVTTLNACDYPSREFSSRRHFFDDAPTEIISRSWKRLVINKEKHITRRGYTLCFLSKLQDSLRRRDVTLPAVTGGEIPVQDYYRVLTGRQTGLRFIVLWGTRQTRRKQ